MEITLEKIELVKDRTGVTYAEAKEALEKADGNVVDAIIAIEECVDEETQTKKLSAQGEALIDKVKEIVKRGNVSKIQVKHGDDIILNLPVNAGIFGVVIAPWGILAATVAAFGLKCNISIVKTDGSILDVTGKAEEAYGGAVQKGTEIYEGAKTKSTQFYEEMKDKAPDVYENMKEKTEAAGAILSQKLRFGKNDGEVVDAEDVENLENLEELGAEVADAAADIVEDLADKAEDLVEEAEKVIDAAEDAVEN